MDTLRLAHSEYLNLLYVLPVVVILFVWVYRKRAELLEKFADISVHKLIIPEYSKVKPIVKASMITLAMLLLILGLANPQLGSKVEEVKQVGIDVFILLDVSKSMTAEDIKPNRLEKAKYDISRLIQRLRGDRIGLIVFAGNAYVQIPLTTDYSAANLFLNAVDVNSVPQQGTAISSAIKLALESFKQDADTKKAIVVITDGEDHEGDLEPVVQEAVDKGVLIYAIGLGSPAGVPIPIYNASGQKTGYKKNRKGEVVLTKLDEATLKMITEKGKGKYYRGSSTEDELEKIYKDLANLEQTEFGATKITDYEDRFYYLLIPALLLLIWEFFIPSTRSKVMAKLVDREEV